ncbi:unnamed protein product [Polarella glacialis]|uniref:Uncharacterized protein n=1 Tax=Polarella glacialis TaxID=89957 RepID=A0A813IWH2_POLGL|nr:unnamed protein product [Polarella glacialis]CAE8656576.1 unnamed protein product [Polarella glacialis]
MRACLQGSHRGQPQPCPRLRRATTTATTTITITTTTTITATTTTTATATATTGRQPPCHHSLQDRPPHLRMGRPSRRSLCRRESHQMAVNAALPLQRQRHHRTLRGAELSRLVG